MIPALMVLVRNYYLVFNKKEVASLNVVSMIKLSNKILERQNYQELD